MVKRTLKVTGVLVALFFLFQMHALGAVFTVSTADELRDSLNQAESNGEDDTIYLLPGHYEGEFGYATLPTATERLRITGSGADQTSIGSNDHAALVIVAQAHVTVENLAIRDCNSDTAGFLFSGNGSLTVTNCRFISNLGGFNGGGLYAETTSGTITIQGCLFDGNTALRGGGLSVSAPNVVLDGNNITNNRLVRTGTGIQEGFGAGVHVDGGGAFFTGANITIRNNLFSVNSADSNILGKGAGLYINGWMMNSITLEGNLFDQNRMFGGGDGGGAYIYGVDGPMNGILLKSNKFKENTVSGTGGGLYVFVAGSMAGPITAVNNVFARNAGGTAGGAYLQNFDGRVIFTNNTSYDNQSASGGDITLRPGSRADIYNNILWDADEGQDLAVLGYGTPYLCSNDINKHTSEIPVNDCGGSNINVDPNLIEYRISERSPSEIKDSGNNSAPGIPGEDIDGEARIIGTTVDMGADEYNPVIFSVWQEVASIGGFDGSRYGFSVDIHKDTLVVGSPYRQVEGFDEAGAVYVYKRGTDNPQEWILEQAIEIPLLHTSYAHFGHSVAIEGNTLVVGARGLKSQNQILTDAGGVFIYERNGTGDSPWDLVFMQYGDQSSGNLGTSVAISGNTVVAGAPGYTPDDIYGGAAFVYVKSSWSDGGVWSEKQVLSPYDLGWNLDGSIGGFGYSVSISDNLIVVGASVNGDVFTFARGDIFYMIEDQIDGEDFEFGRALSIYKNVLAVGNAGSDILFKLTTDGPGLWGEVKSWNAGSRGDNNNDRLDINGAWLVFGHAGLNEVTVHYKYYNPTAENTEPWSIVQTIIHPPDGFEESQFGWATAIDGATLVVGDPARNRVHIYEFPHPAFESPNGYTESATQYGIISQAQTQEFEYDNLSLQDIVGKVAFGSTFRLEVFDPSGAAYGSPIQSSSSPITVEIPRAAAGKWKFKITAVQSVADNHFTFGILTRATEPPEMNGEGTIGTQITITGSGFGTKKGKVLIGGAALKIAKDGWTPTSITGEIKKALPPGVAYDVVLYPKEPKGAPPIPLPGAFTMMAPDIVSAVPNSGLEGTAVTISGDFFSTKKGKVYLGDKNCKVSSWSMDAITFIVPKKMAPGLYNVTVTNKMGADTLVDGFTILIPR